MKKASMFAACLLTLAGMASAPLGAAGYPDRPITLLVGFAPGGSLDLSARALAAAAEKSLGQPIAVENKTGGTGSVALAVLLNAQPDGYTLVATPSSVLIRVSQMQAFPFKPLKDFKPVVGFAAPEIGFVVKSDAPWKNIKELAEYAKKNPAKIRYATDGNGSTTHGAVQALVAKDKLQMIHVPFKGSVEAITALLGGHVEMGSLTTEFISSVQAGQTRLLATMGEKRMPKFPNVPTLKESGYDFVAETVYCVVAPSNLPADVAKKLEDAFAKASESKEYKDALDKINLTPVHYGGKAFEAFLKTNWKRVNTQLIEAGLIKEAATQPE